MTLVAPLEVGLACADLDRMSSFYRSAFAFQEVSRIDVAIGSGLRTPLSTGDYTVLRLQSPFGERLKLLSPRISSPPPAPAPEADIIGRRNTVFLTLIVDDLEAALQGLATAGGRAIGEPAVIRPGFTIALAKDPEGNLLEVSHYASIAQYRDDLAARPGRARGKRDRSETESLP